MIDWIKDYKIPVGAAIGIVSALGYIYLWLYAEFVTAAKFGEYQNQTERRILLEKQQQLDAEVLKIEVKCRAYPKQCNAVDKALVERYRRDLQRVQRDLNDLQRK